MDHMRAPRPLPPAAPAPLRTSFRAARLGKGGIAALLAAWTLALACGEDGDHTDDRVQSGPWQLRGHGVNSPQLAAAAPELNLPRQVGVHRTRGLEAHVPNSNSQLDCVGSNAERLAYKFGLLRS